MTEITQLTRRSLFAAGIAAAASQLSPAAQSAPVPKPLRPPATGKIPVAFPISDGATVIDYSGPWEVFQDTMVGTDTPFQLYTVSESTQPVTASGGLKLIPDYSFGNAPPPKVIVIPAQKGSDAMRDWIRRASKSADLTMSVCTGAFLLAKTGLLAGQAATTHHGFYTQFATEFPDIQLKRGFRFVEAGDNLASAGGLTSGIDLALRVVERYYGRAVAERTAFFMEYQGKGWMDSSGAANSMYAEAKAPGNDLIDPVCGMALPLDATLRSTYKGTTYGFCSEEHKRQFDKEPAKYIHGK